MKEISNANQAERKRLAAVHSSLSQQTQSQPSCVAEGSQSLRQKLLGLAARQKILLQCFKVQKEVVEKLDKLLVQCKDQAVETTSTSAVHATELEGSLGPGPAKRPSGPSAAIPNLLQHLKPQPLQESQRQCQSKILKSSAHQSHHQLHPSNTRTQNLPSSQSANSNACRIEYLPQEPKASSVTPMGVQQISTVPQHIPQPRPLLQPQPPLTNSTHSRIAPLTQTHPLLQTQVVPQVQVLVVCIYHWYECICIIKDLLCYSSVRPWLYLCLCRH